jgi:hypothetical protein
MTTGLCETKAAFECSPDATFSVALFEIRLPSADVKSYVPRQNNDESSDVCVPVLVIVGLESRKPPTLEELQAVQPAALELYDGSLFLDGETIRLHVVENGEWMTDGVDPDGEAISHPAVKKKNVIILDTGLKGWVRKTGHKTSPAYASVSDQPLNGLKEVGISAISDLSNVYTIAETKTHHVPAFEYQADEKRVQDVRSSSSGTSCQGGRTCEADGEEQRQNEG